MPNTPRRYFGRVKLLLEAGVPARDPQKYRTRVVRETVVNYRISHLERDNVAVMRCDAEHNVECFVKHFDGPPFVRTLMVR